MIINIRKKDILAGQPLVPGWYKVVVSKIGKVESVGDRIDQPITFDFEAPELKVDERDIEYTFYNCVTKGIGFVVSFMAAVMSKPRQEIAEALESGKEIPFDFDLQVGKKLQIKLVNSEYQGRIQNKIEGFLPYDSEVPV